MFDFVKQMHDWGCDIKQYVAINAITATPLWQKPAATFVEGSEAK